MEDYGGQLGVNTRLERMMEQYGNDLLRICCVYLKDASMAEDAVQETFIKAYRHMASFRSECSEKTWLVSIAVNTCRDMRRGAWFRYVDRSVDMEKLGIVAESQKKRSPLLREIMALPRKQMEVILLRYYAEMTQSEIAKLLSISEAAVSKRLARARNMLRCVLEGGEACE